MEESSQEPKEKKTKIKKAIKRSVIKTERLSFPYQVTVDGKNVGSVPVPAKQRLGLYLLLCEVMKSIPAYHIDSYGLNRLGDPDGESKALVIDCEEKGASLLRKLGATLEKVKGGYSVQPGIDT
jgi:hypothetical protein